MLTCIGIDFFSGGRLVTKFLYCGVELFELVDIEVVILLQWVFLSFELMLIIDRINFFNRVDICLLDYSVCFGCLLALLFFLWISHDLDVGNLLTLPRGVLMDRAQ